jgi:hypothetical protein
MKSTVLPIVVIVGTVFSVSGCGSKQPAVAPPRSVAGVAREGASSHKGLESTWSLEGTWTGVVSDRSRGAIYAIGPQGKCVELDTAGKQQREIKLPEGAGSIGSRPIERGSAPLLRIASLRGDPGKALLTFSRYGALKAYDLSGKQLWSYPPGHGIDDVWTHDLNGDGSDEVVVGHNGGTGLHILDSTGKLLWKSTAIGNVWHVCAGDVLGEGKPQVVATSAAGKVHIFDSGGSKSRLSVPDATPTWFAPRKSLKKIRQR